MKSAVDEITRSLEEVWEMKQAVFEDIKNMSSDERRVYYHKGLEEAAHLLGVTLVENPDGTKSFI